MPRCGERAGILFIVENASPPLGMGCRAGMGGPPKLCPPGLWPCPWHFPGMEALGWRGVCSGGQSREPLQRWVRAGVGAGGLGSLGGLGAPHGLAAPSSPVPVPSRWGRPALAHSAVKPVDNKTVHLSPALGPACSGRLPGTGRDGGLLGRKRGFWEQGGSGWGRGAGGDVVPQGSREVGRVCAQDPRM